jgi:hypothetical protein
MPVIHEGNTLGDLLKYESPNLYSREAATVGAGQHLALGTVVSRDAGTGKLYPLRLVSETDFSPPAGVLATDTDARLADRDDALLIARLPAPSLTRFCTRAPPAARPRGSARSGGARRKPAKVLGDPSIPSSARPELAAHPTAGRRRRLSSRGGGRIPRPAKKLTFYGSFCTLRVRKSSSM